MLKNSKKSIGPVVTSALLLVVAVVSVVGFQNWFQTFSTSTLSGVEEDSNLDSILNVQGLIDNILYLKSGSDQNLSLLKVVDSKGVTKCSFIGSKEVNSSGIVGMWKLNDESSVIGDLSGNGNNGTLYGNTRLLMNFDDGTATDQSAYKNNGTLMNGINCTISGISGKGCKSETIGNYIKINDSPSLNFDKNALSVSLWFNSNINISQNLNLYLVILTKRLSVNGGFIFHFNNISEKLVFQFSNGTNFVGVLSSEKIIKNKWYNFVGVLDSNYLKIYVDGKLSNSLAINSRIKPSVGINLSLLDNSITNASIDEVAIYSKALSSDEVLDLYDSKKAKFIEFKKTGLDKAVEFDGIDDYIVVPDSNSLDLVTNFTIYLKYNLKNIIPLSIILHKGQFPLYNYKLGKNLQYNEFSITDGINQITVNSNKYKFTNSKIFIVNFNSSHLNLYINNYKSSSLISNSISQINSNPLYFGKYFYGSGYEFVGQIDEIRIYNRTLTEQEINQLYWYSISPQLKGINQIDLSSCNLTKGKAYDLVGFSSNSKFEQKFISK